MGKFLLGLLIGLVALPAFAFLYILFGYAPVATSAPPFPMERKVTSMALHARIGKEAPKTAAIPATEPNLLAGAEVYREHCAMCHGLKGHPPTATANGMFPKPPQLFRGKGVTDDTPGETFWKVNNGIRLTGMPAYRDSLNETQMWQVSQLLATADKLTPKVNEVVSQPPPAH
jgi:mono/diheme cytochrome c family protein